MDRKADYTKVIMNPVRMRIVQYLMLHESGTVAEIGDDLNDIPKASLYRHIKMLENTEIILVIRENKKRGTLEKVYELSKAPMGTGEPDKEDVQRLVQGTLLSIMTDFSIYFKKEANEISEFKKDMLSVSSAVLLLSDEEMRTFFQKIGEIYNQLITNTPGEGRKPRQITWISSPTGGQEEDKENK